MSQLYWDGERVKVRDTSWRWVATMAMIAAAVVLLDLAVHGCAG